jgi:cytochrome o ubiquinol oxidase operon protein cyoD
MSQTAAAAKAKEGGSMRSYTTGFIISIGLTIAAYLLVTQNILSGWGLVYAVIGLAVFQLFAQLFFFLHLGRGPNRKWNMATLILMLIIVFIVVAGSLWIMHNLNYHMSPQQMNLFMRQQDGGI